MPSWKDFLEQLAVIRQAWIPFTSAVLFAIGLIYAAENWTYSSIISARDSIIAGKDGIIANRDSTIQTLNERIRLRDDKLSNTLKSATAEQAQTIIENLQKQVAALTPRHLSEAQRKDLIDSLKTSVGTKKMHIMYDASCGDCNKYALGLKNTFEASGWNVSGSMGFGFSALPQSGIGLMTLSNTLNQDEQSIADALRAAHIPFDQIVDPRRFHRPGEDSDILISQTPTL